MARKRKRKKKTTGKVSVRYHTRSPRGSNSGKPRQRVRAHSRGKPRKKPKN